MAYDRTFTKEQSEYIAPFIALIHAVDSIKLIQEINKEQ